MNGKTPIIIDADTGIDDAMAVIYASRLSNVDIRLVVGSTGNCSSTQSAQNNINLLKFVKRPEIPVAQGIEDPLGKLTLRISVHGKTGLGEYVFESTAKRSIFGDIGDLIHDVAVKTPEKLVIVCTGPATNIAYYLKKYPKDIDQIETIYFSGGLIEELKEGELPYVSFNVGFDPMAMEMLLETKIPIVICPSNLGHDAHFTPKEVKKIAGTNRTGRMLNEIFKFYHDRHIKVGVATHDLCAFMSFSNPKLFTYRPAAVKVVYMKELKSGVLTFDFNSSGKAKKVLVATKIKAKSAKKAFFRELKKMP